MNPNIDNRTLVLLVYTCHVCQGMQVTARDLNHHLDVGHQLPVGRYNRPGPAHIEMIPTQQYIYLNMLAPIHEHLPQHVFLVTLRHACSLCHFHYPTLERLLRHMEAHFRAETEEEQQEEIRQLNLTFEFYDTHYDPNHPNRLIRRPQQEGVAANVVENENEGLETGDENASHADDEDQDSDQQDSGHATSQSSVDDDDDDDDRSQETVVNEQQEFGPLDMDGHQDEGFIDNPMLDNDRDMALGPFLDGGEVNLNDQPIFGDVALQEAVDQDIQQDDHNIFRFVHFENP